MVEAGMPKSLFYYTLGDLFYITGSLPIEFHFCQSNGGWLATGIPTLQPIVFFQIHKASRTPRLQFANRIFD